MPVARLLVLACLVVAVPGAARAQFVDRSIPVEEAEAPAATAAATATSSRTDGADGAETAEAAGATETRDLEVRLTLSSFVFRELGDEAPPLVADGDAPDDASPVRRFFGDARLELEARRLAGGGGRVRLDGRVRQTTRERYQAGAASGDEYEVREASYTQALGATSLRLGRQVVRAVGATRIDGLAVERRLAAAWSATAFAGAYPQRGSRSLTTDYADVRGGGGPLVPLAGGAGVSYRRPSLHGDLGVGGITAFQDVPGASPADASRVFTTAAGYWRPTPSVDAYHYLVVDVAGGGGARLTNGSLGLDVFPLPALELSLTAHHVDTELFEISARNVLADPDPAAMGVVQNDAALVRVSQDLARAGASLALARARFELSASAGLHRRPAIDVPAGDGTVVPFPAASMVEGTLQVVDRRAPGGLRVSIAGSLFAPAGDAAPSRSRGVVARAAASRSGERVDVEADVMVQRFEDLGPAGGCTSLDPLACHGTARSRAAQAGALVAWRAGEEWMLLVDGHVGVRDASSSTVGMTVDWPRVLSLSAFARLAWRYR